MGFTLEDLQGVHGEMLASGITPASWVMNQDTVQELASLVRPGMVAWGSHVAIEILGVPVLVTDHCQPDTIYLLDQRGLDQLQHSIGAHL